jgi:hypothetical protein
MVERSVLVNVEEEILVDRRNPLISCRLSRATDDTFKKVRPRRLKRRDTRLSETHAPGPEPVEV